MNKVMEPPYKFPQDDYALTILTNAANAMNNRSSESINPTSTLYDQQRPTSTLSATGITNPDTHHNASLGQAEGIRTSFPSFPSLRGMETLSYSQMEPERHPYLTPGFFGIGSQVATNATNSLSILNSDTYDDGRSAMRKMRTKQPGDIALPFGVEQSNETRAEGEHRTDSEEPEKPASKGRSRKRRNESQNEDDEEEARKKARGRPRVDPKDETAADRRRTQIRMAQRAYRHRKETTITTLEKQVQDLRGTNEEMSNIFISLYDFAVGKGLLQREPEFGQQLQATTQRFLALVKASQNEDESHEENTKEIDQAPPEPPRKAKSSKAAAKKQIEAPQNEESAANPWGGYTLMKDDSSTPADETSMDYSQQNYQNMRQNDLQVITRPTEENASFPFEPFDIMDLQTYRVELPPIEDYLQNFFPSLELPLPTTAAFNEFSFARRLQRTTVEKGYQLLSQESPNQDRLNEIFGLSFMYETKDQIKDRLKGMIDRSSKETLHQWRAPFVHVGGAGTYYPQNDELNRDLMPKFRTGYSMGPFTSQVCQAQDFMLDDMRCTLPGFEGEFFDANDVEGYLRGRGIEIPPTADFVMAELDLSEFTSPRSTSSGETAVDLSPRTPRSPVNKYLGTGNSQSLDFTKPEPKAFPFPLTLYSDWSTTPDMIDPALGTITELPDDDNVTPAVAVNEQPYSERQLVRLNVNVLTHEVSHHAVCLGRAPGYRPRDVNAAILAAIQGYEANNGVGEPTNNQ